MTMTFRNKDNPDLEIEIAGKSKSEVLWRFARMHRETGSEWDEVE